MGRGHRDSNINILERCQVCQISLSDMIQSKIGHLEKYNVKLLNSLDFSRIRNLQLLF